MKWIDTAANMQQHPVKCDYAKLSHQLAASIRLSAADISVLLQILAIERAVEQFVPRADTYTETVAEIRRAAAN